MKLLLDAGHNASVWGHPLTPGKRSPQVPPGFYEGDFNRDVCEEAGINSDVLFLNPGPIGKRLKDRVADVNLIHALEPSVLCSVHANAADNSGQWHPASGTTVFIHPNASKTSEIFAEILLKEMVTSTALPSRGVKRARFAMLTCKCPAVLLEALFMTHIKDVKTPPWQVAEAIVEAFGELKERLEQ